MNKKQQEICIGFLEELYQAEMAEDAIKVNMANCQGFHPSLLVGLLGAQVYPHTFLEYLDGRVACNLDELHQIFVKFDAARKGWIDLKDFTRELTPFGAQPVSRPPHPFLSHQIEGHFLALMMEIVKNHRILEVGRKDVSLIQPFAIFEQIDSLQAGIITREALKSLFDANQVEVTHTQLSFLLHALRRRYYHEISLEVFCEQLFPKQFGYYLNFERANSDHLKSQQNRREELEHETLRRSRQQATLMELQVSKAERRKQAEVQRLVEVDQKIRDELIQHEENMARHLRQAQIEEQLRIKHSLFPVRQAASFEGVRSPADLARAKSELEASKTVAMSNYEKNAALYAQRKQEEIKNEITQSARQQNKLNQSRDAIGASRTLTEEVALGIERRRQALMEAADKSQKHAHFSTIEPLPGRVGMNALLTQPAYSSLASLGGYGSTPAPHFSYLTPTSPWAPDPSLLARQNRLAEMEKELQDTRFQIRDRRTQVDLSQKYRQHAGYESALKRSYGY